MTNEESINQYLHPLATEGEFALPSRFTYPFLYTPHPLAIKASEELKAYLRTKDEWKEEISRGKMFGVLWSTTPLPAPPRGRATKQNPKSPHGEI